MKALTQEARTKTNWKKAYWFWVAVVAFSAAWIAAPALRLSDRTSALGFVLYWIGLLVFWGCILFARPKTDRKKDVGRPRMQRPWYRLGIVGIFLYALCLVLSYAVPSTGLAGIGYVLGYAAWMLWLVALKLWTDAHEKTDLQDLK